MGLFDYEHIGPIVGRTAEYQGLPDFLFTCIDRTYARSRIGKRVATQTGLSWGASA
jgi:hypothetical protein